MTVTRFIAYHKNENHEDNPYWSHIEFFDVKMKGRKVLHILGIDEIHSLSIEQLDNEKAANYSKMLYSVYYHKQTDQGFVVEITASNKNVEVTRHKNSIRIHVIAHVYHADKIDLKEWNEDMPVTQPYPRVPHDQAKSLKAPPQEDTGYREVIKDNAIGKKKKPKSNDVDWGF